MSRRSLFLLLILGISIVALGRASCRVRGIGPATSEKSTTTTGVSAITALAASTTTTAAPASTTLTPSTRLPPSVPHLDRPTRRGHAGRRYQFYRDQVS